STGVVTRVTMNNPPTSGAYTSDTTAVEAIVEQDAPAFFTRMPIVGMGLTSLPVRARAVAKQGFSTACIYALDPTAKSALNFGGNATMNLGCGAVSESSDPKSIDISSNVNISLTNGASLGAVGGYNNNGTVSPTYAIDGKILNPGDPLSGLAMPTYSTQTCF